MTTEKAKPIKTVLLVYKSDIEQIEQYRDAVIGEIKKNNLVPTVITLSDLESNLEVKNPPDLVMVLGGDGTFLTASRHFIQAQTPIVGINAGNLGFLTRIDHDNLSSCVKAIAENNYFIEYRLMLEIDGKPQAYALNDIVLKNAHPTRMAQINLYDGQTLITTYDADGLIITTPTGSTAYNLSAGGPILSPTSEVIAITPICSHSLSSVPIVLDANRELRITSGPKNDTALICSLDGEDLFELAPGDTLHVSAAQRKLPLVAFSQPQEVFYKLLTQKLGWSNNPRKKP